MKEVPKKSGIVLILIAGMTGIYTLGPAPPTPEYNIVLPQLPLEPIALEQWVSKKESSYIIKADNQARIIWADDSLKARTSYALVYLHGFSASQEDGNPIHRQLAKRYGMNLYLSRLAEHGLVSDNPLLGYTATASWDDAKEALAIGSVLGDRVILMSTSTGGTLSLMLCSLYPDIAGQILMSPNIAINDPMAWMLNNHWGLNLAKKVIGGDFRTVADTTARYTQYWNGRYRVESLPQLEELLETTMKPEVFQRVKAPTLMLYYYKDEDHQDQVVNVDEMLRMFDLLGTEPGKKKKTALPNVANHALGAAIKSHDLISVETEINRFCDSILGLKKRL